MHRYYKVSAAPRGALELAWPCRVVLSNKVNSQSIAEQLAVCPELGECALRS